MESLTSGLAKSLLTQIPVIAELDRRARSDNYCFPVETLAASALVFLGTLVTPKRVLDLGLGYGKSALVWSRVVAEDGVVDTVEKDPAAVEVARMFLQRGGARNVRIHRGDAAEVLPRLTKGYDLIFLDLEPTDYYGLWEGIVELLRIGGLVVIENLWDDETCLRLVGSEGLTKVRRFAMLLAEDRRLVVTVMGESMAAGIRIL